MKKFLFSSTLLVFFLIAFSTGAKAEYVFRLASIESDDLLETVYYTYLDDNLLLASDYTMNDGTKVIDSMYYDANGNPTIINFYQLINNEWRWTSYVEFTYDDFGNKTSRKNYNDFGSGFSMGGEYLYSYDEDNKMIHWELYMDGELSQTCDFTYNDDGLVVEEIGQASYWGSPMENSWQMTYLYDSNNNRISSAQSFWNGSGWDLYSEDQFFFDADNNCIKRDKLIDNVVVDRHEYIYDMDYTYDQIVFPNNPEAFFPEFVPMNHRLVLDKWYTEDASGTLSYICDYNYNYESIVPQNVPVISITPESLSFVSTATEDEKILTVTNSGNADGEFVATITGENADLFSLNNENHAIVAPGSYYELSVSALDAENDGIYYAIIHFETNDPERPVIDIPVTYEVTVGIEELQNEISLFPNPTVDVLNIQTAEGGLLTICDLSGRIFYQEEMKGNHWQIDMSNFRSGIYMANIQLASGKVITKRIVVAK